VSKFKVGDKVTPRAMVYEDQSSGEKLVVVSIGDSAFPIRCSNTSPDNCRGYLEHELEDYDVYHSPLNQALS
jgi:hypothetical protein